ncbi:MAG: hypothetical protein ACTSPB_12710 [Candidatus Thorarchaeota archaeon]
MKFDSDDEKWFSWYLDDLMRLGAVIAWGRAQPFLLSNKVEYRWIRKMKTKEKLETNLLFHPHSYTPDFKIIWNPEFAGFLFHYTFETDVYKKPPKGKVPFIANVNSKTGKPYSIIEIKPASTFGNKHDHAREATLNIKWVWWCHRVYIQTIVVKPDNKGAPASALFPTTFTPSRYLYTDNTKKPRKIKWETVKASQYLQRQKTWYQMQQS